MEELNNYKIGEFFQIQDEELVANYMFYLEGLKPKNEINIDDKIIKVTDIKEMKFFEVTNIRELISEPSTEGIIEVFTMVTGLENNELLKLDIIQFYAVLNHIQKTIIEINNMENNHLTSNHENIKLEMVNAGQRMGVFGPLNVIDSLAGGDITKWEMIENMPYLTVFSKLYMETVKSDIERDLEALPDEIKNM